MRFGTTRKFDGRRVPAVRKRTLLKTRLERDLSAIFLFLFLIGITPLWGQTTPETSPSPEAALSGIEKEARDRLKAVLLEESPAELFSDHIGDSKVEIFAQGSWKTSIGGYLAISTSDGDSAVFPGFSQTPWTNNVDLSISLWLQEQYFFETNFSDGFAFNSFLLGYENPDSDSEGLKSVRIGNKDVTIAHYPGLPFQGQADSSPGMRASWKWPGSDFEILARLVNSTHYVERFEGGRSLGTNTLEAGRFIRNRFFVLPYTNLNSIKVWIESGTGTLSSDGHRYRLATVDDFSFIDASSGSFGLSKTASGRVRAGFTVTSSSVRQRFPALDLPLDLSDSVVYDLTTNSDYDLRVLQHLIDDFSWTVSEARSPVQIDGVETFLLSIPGNFSPYEDYAWYPLAENVVPSRVTVTGQTAPLRFSEVDDALKVLNETDAVSSRYPLRSVDGIDAATLYFRLSVPDSEAGDPAQITIESQGNPSAVLSLSRPALEGSLVVFRNGSPDSGVSLGTDGQSLAFSNPPRDTDVIEVSYDALEREGGAQAIQAGIGFRASPVKDISISSGLGVHWPIANEVSTNQDASAHVSTGAQLDVGNLDSGTGLRFTAMAAVSIPSTSASVLVTNYADSFVAVSVSASNITPSIFPGLDSLVEMKDSTLHPALIAGDATYLSQAFLSGLGVLPRSQFLTPVFRDAVDSNGSYYPWNAVSASAVTPAEGQAVGPYVAGPVDGDEVTGTVAVIEVDQGSAVSTAWTSAEFRLSDDQTLALSNSGKLSFSLQTLSLTRAVDIFVQIGDLGEDIDGDGVLRAGAVGEKGFPYLLPNGSDYARAMYPVTGRDGAVPTEDRDANGISVQERTGTHFGRYVGHFGQGAHTNWTSLSLAATPDEARRLLKAKVIRFVIVSEAGSTALTGKILIGALHVDTPGFVDQALSTSTSGARIVVDSGLQTSLESAFSGEFSADSSAALASLQWTSNSSADVSFTQIMSNFSFEEFGRFFFYIYPVSGSNQLHISLQGESSSSEINQISFDTDMPAASQWYKVLVDTNEQVAQIIDGDGNIVQNSGLTRSGPGLIFSKLIIQIADTGSGKLLVDNISLSAAIPSVSGTVGIQAAWRYAETLLQFDSFKFLGNIRTNHSFEIKASRALTDSSFVSPNDPSIDYSGSLGFTLSYIDLLAGLRTQWQSGTQFVEEYHKLVFPYGAGSPVVFSDNFATRFAVTPESYLKESSINLILPGAVNSKLTVSATQSSYDLKQTYSATLGIDRSLPFSVDSTVNVDQQADSAIDQSADFGELLKQAYIAYQPVAETSIVSRTASLNGGAHVKLDVFSADATADISYLSEVSAPLPFTPVMNLVSGITAGSDALGFSFDFKYGRLTQVRESQLPTAFEDQVSGALERFSELNSSFLSVPFFELVDPDGLSRFLDGAEPFGGASQVPGFTTRISRNLDTAWTALLVPKSFSFGFGRRYEKKATESSDSRALGFGVDWTAINMLGSSGSVKVTDLFESDEFRYSFYPQWRWSDVSSPSWRYDASISALFLGLKIGGEANDHSAERKLAMTGLLDTQAPGAFRFTDSFFIEGTGTDDSTPGISNDTALSFSWAYDIPDLKPELMNKKLTSVAFLYNLETVSLSYLSVSEGSSTSTDKLSAFIPQNPSVSSNTAEGWKLVLGHSSYLLLPGIGYATAHLSLGLYSNDTGEVILGVQAGVEARIVL